MRLSAETRVGYDSNVFNRDSDDPSGDVDSPVIGFQLYGSVQDELERGSYRASYSPKYSINTAQEVGNRWNHDAAVGGRYNFSPRTSLSVGDSFAWVEKLSVDPDSADDDPNVDDSDDRRTLSNSASTVLSHQFTKRLSSFVGGDYTIYRHNRRSSNDSDYYSAYTGLDYALDQRIRVGAGVFGAYRTFQGDEAPDALIDLDPGPGLAVAQACFGEASPRSRTASFSAYLSGAYQFDPTMNVSVRAGPARIESTNFLCLGPFWGKFESDETTWFAQAEFAKRWEFVKTSVNYRRQEGTGGAGTSTVNDQIIGRIDWQISRFWNAGLRGSWLRRESTVTRGPTSETITYSASLKVSRQFLRQLRGFANVSYRRQDEDDQRGSGESRDFDTWRVFVGMRYEFEPLSF